ncbi:MAG: trigger factor [Chlorobi bacterium]|nr:trigger factor [Chlorobiota bacterium]
MNVTQEKIDDLNTILKVKVEQNDYEEKVNNVLKDYKRKANVPGFRPGKVPSGMIKKLYGKAVLVDEVNKLVSESISKFIIDEKLNMLGEPLPSNKQGVIDFDTQSDYEFMFDLGLAPEFELNLSKKDKLIYYDLLVDESQIEATIKGHAQRYGNIQNVDIVEDKEVLRGTLSELNSEGEILEGGIFVQEAMLSVEYIKDDETKKKFIGANKNQIITFNPKIAFENETDISSLLKISKEEVADIKSDFQFVIQEISKHVPAEINQELFDKVYGKDSIKSEEEFREKIRSEIKVNLNYESDYKLLTDAKKKFIDKFKLTLPDEFLKRWLITSNENLKEEEIEKDYPHFQKDLSWQLIKDKIIKENNISISEEEMLNHAKKITALQFQQYGLLNLEEIHIENYAKELLNKEEEKRKIRDQLFEEKILEFLKEIVKIENKEITIENFNKLLEKESKKK